MYKIIRQAGNIEEKMNNKGDKGQTESLMKKRMKTNSRIIPSGEDVM